MIFELLPWSEDEETSKQMMSPDRRSQRPSVVPAAQKMALGHLIKHCTLIPQATRLELIRLKEESKSSGGGGKKYWGRALRAFGIRETDEGLLWGDIEVDDWSPDTGQGSKEED